MHKMDLDGLKQTDQQPVFTRAGCVWSLIFGLTGLAVYAGALTLLADLFAWLQP